MESAKEELNVLLHQCQQQGVSVTELNSVKKFLSESKIKKLQKWQKLFRWLLAFGVMFYAFHFYNTELQSKRCLLDLPRYLRYAFRPPENCDFCRDIHFVQKINGTTSEEFRLKYAYSGVPVVVTDATKNWTALNKFNYWYFRHVYLNAKRHQKILDCQFLPYKTGFRDIYEALDMPQERVDLQPNTAPWYFGWSNCNPETAEIFRQHYGRPYFLPETSENNAVDWFFIGTAGLGAHMHIDNVRLPSWQAQLSGSKRWILAPPPECYFDCRQIDVVVETGEIILLDTNKWYHQTFVQPGILSLTIGAEYD